MGTLRNFRQPLPACEAPRRRNGARIGLAVALGTLLYGFIPVTAHAAMYKWVDDKGVVHYTDKIPPEAVNKGSTQINKEGYTVKKVDPANAEQVRAREQEAARQRETASKERAAEAIEVRRDQAVLNSYTTEGDIDLAKARSMKTLQAALQSAQAYSAQLTKRKMELLARKETFGGKPVPADIERELAAGDAELRRQNDLIALKQKQLQDVVAKYDADTERWRALKGAADAAPAATASASSAAASAAAKKK